MSVPPRRVTQLSATGPSGHFVWTEEFPPRGSVVEQSNVILIIEDEPSVADALRLILEDHGHRVLVAVNGGDGLGLARRGGVCLVVTDLFLPDLSGLEVLRALRAEWPRLPVVLITSRDTPELFVEAHRDGAAAVLPKPFAPAQILYLIESLGRG